MQVQGAGVISLLNSGQLNQAAVQQIAQAVGGSATNLASVTQGNVNVPGEPSQNVSALLLLRCICWQVIIETRVAMLGSRQL